MACKAPRIGVLRQFTDRPNAPAEVTAIANQSFDDIAMLGATLVDIELHGLPGLAASTYISFQYDMNNYLERLGEAAPVKSVQEIIESGHYDPSLDLTLFNLLRPDIPPEKDPAHATVERVSNDVVAQVMEVMDSHELDAIVYPTVTRETPRIIDDGLFFELLDNARLSSMIGFPSISVPGGMTPDGMPLGIEFLGRPFSEPTLLNIAYAYEQGTLHRAPPVSVPALPGETLVVPESTGIATLLLGVSVTVLFNRAREE